MKSKNNPLLLLDSNYLLHRVMHIKNYLEMSYNGVFTGGVYGFLKSVKYAADRCQQPRKIFSIWDGDKSERRMELHSRYKARPSKDDNPITPEGTPPMSYPVAWQHQKRLLEEILPKMGVISYCCPKREADDVIAKIIDEWQQFWNVNQCHCIIVSDDRDYFQLVDENVSIYRPIKKQFVTEESFQEFSGYPTPVHYLYKHALVGDSSDNIKGMEGVGGKTAHKILDDLKLRGVPEYDYGLIEARMMALGKSLLKKWNAGGNKQFLRNLQLVDMLLEEFEDEEIDKMEEAFFKNCPRLSESYLAGKLAELGMTSFIAKFRYFLEPFRALNYPFPREAV